MIDTPRWRRGNRRPRAALLQTAADLAPSNHPSRACAGPGARSAKGPRGVRLKIAKAVSRPASARAGGGSRTRAANNAMTSS
jgi:hypothetical protein